MIRSLFAALLLVAAAAPVAAQRALPSEVDSLARVRVTWADGHGRTVGGLLAADSSALLIDPVRFDERMTVPVAQVERLEVSLGQRTPREGALRGAKKGAMVGLAASAVLITMGIVADAREECEGCWISVTGIAVYASIPIIGFTTGGGALLGSINPGERWQEVSVPPRVRP